jgi:hypothetical protein
MFQGLTLSLLNAGQYIQFERTHTEKDDCTHGKQQKYDYVTEKSTGRLASC